MRTLARGLTLDWHSALSFKVEARESRGEWRLQRVLRYPVREDLSGNSQFTSRNSPTIEHTRKRLITWVCSSEPRPRRSARKSSTRAFVLWGTDRYV